ncbi:MFS transporter [Frateuria defendens]|uniref:MFS transporter n=1 Tax=Frateuria defendens TaxID=2219559 RepID=UPI00066FE50A|nr:MFS transporter [Frateuria defendens]
MNTSNTTPPARRHWLDIVGIPRPLAWGFFGLLLFMIGDGVEAGYLAPFLGEGGVSPDHVALTFTLYGITVSISSWLSGALSDIWGPKRVMWAGLAIWIVFEVLFLLFGAATHNFPVMLITYTLRGFGYPLFAFGFLVWIAAATPARQMGSAAGWFWFAFAAGLPTLGSLFASFAIPVIGQLATFWCALGLVACGGLITLLCTHEKSGLKRLAPEGQSPLATVLLSVTILWKEPKIAAAGVVRTINTASEYAFLVIMPGFFTKVIGFSLQQWLQLLSALAVSNVVVNLASGVLADKLGYRKIIGLGGCLGSAVSVLLFYYMPLHFRGDYPIALLFGVFYGATLACFVPLSGLVPQIAPKNKGAALSILGLGAGASTWFGPGIVTVFGESLGIEGVLWIFSGLYVLSGLLTICLTVSPQARAYSARHHGQETEAVLAH